MKRPVIKCPNCGAEYMAAEVYLPDYFLGKPSNIVKGREHNILAYDGEDMDLEEEYQCDYCNQKFKVKATVTFKTESYTDLFDDDEYVSKGE